MNTGLPVLFLERLKLILPPSVFYSAEKSFFLPEPFTLRVNTLKITRDEAVRWFCDHGIRFEPVDWLPEAFVLPDEISSRLDALKQVLDQGLFYRQNLSSILAVSILDPKPQENILDMCAAPGGKTVQIARLVGPQGSVTALEAVRKRYYKLKSVVSLMGADNVSCFCIDARRFRPRGGLFDKILLDAQCSCEACFRAGQPGTYAYWSPRKIKELSRKQKGLLLSAGRLVKEGGGILYSTCTFSPEENEAVISWFLRKTGSEFKVIKPRIKGAEVYPALRKWQEREFDPQVSGCLRIVPKPGIGGFFIALLQRSG